jgi:hypothetical protein
MHLDQGEVILKVFYHHYSPFIVRLLKIISTTIPFYFLIFIFKDSFDFTTVFFLHLFIVSVFSIVTVYVTLVYWLDRLVVTNKRLIFIDWTYLTVKTEYETELKDVQDITSIEKGIFAILPIFDYGTIEIKTASNQTTIVFVEAPNPNGIKKFVQTVLIHI